ncbi:peptide/nickel transport system ATP-binding protein [Pacificibacter maritimus]|uniref:Peptide/nickel transport system ATP-binding protein n=1 Tax=Pacificibacter maritimus TaxID=762213 RepID=A0A3N4UYJ3_9RHOB|nr:ABC transporter ATP-binding protein [Pacificibacter maritimus]RPE66640.1 peptide/nickel transport system ATP-binding protein [Pacificibacter maritimus]
MSATRPIENTDKLLADPVLTVKGLSVELRRRNDRIPIVQDVSYELRAGEILGIVGESGAGKSMSGNAVAGLLRPPLYVSQGEVHLNAQRIDTLPANKLVNIRGKRIAMVFQDPLTSLNPVFTVGEQLVETIERHTPRRGQEAKDRAQLLLEQVGIPAAADRLTQYPHEFSGGMRQRVVIALALAGEPDVLFADEPTTALDVSIQAQIIALFKRLCREKGLAAALVTHDMGVIAQATDRVAVMYAGRIVETGPTAEVLKNPRHPYTSGLMQSIPEIGRRLHRLPQLQGAMPRPGQLPQGCAFSDRCAYVTDACRKAVPKMSGSKFHSVACVHPLTQEV